MYAALKLVVRRPWATPSFPFNRKAISREILAYGIRLALYRLSLDFIFICLRSALALTIYLLSLTNHFLCSFLRHILSFLDDVPKIFSYAEISYLFVIAGILLAFPVIHIMGASVGRLVVNSYLCMLIVVVVQNRFRPPLRGIPRRD